MYLLELLPILLASIVLWLISVPIIKKSNIQYRLLDNERGSRKKKPVAPERFVDKEG
jgi:hypothetical protein